MNIGREAAALVDLWDDPSREVNSAVLGRLKELGRQLLPSLLQLRSDDSPERRLRASEVAHWVHLQTFMPLWAHEVQKKQINIERSLLLLSLFDEPLLDIPGYRDQIDRMADTCPPTAANRATAEAAITLVDHFQHTLQFSPSTHLADPGAMFLSSVIDRRRGHRLTLAALFLLLSRQLSLPFAVSASTQGLLLLYPLESRTLLFDLDNDFELIEHSEWSRQQLVAGISSRPIAPSAISDRHLLLLILREAHARVQRSGDERTASELEDLLTLAEPVER